MYRVIALLQLRLTLAASKVRGECKESVVDATFTPDVTARPGATGEASPCIQKKRMMLAKEGICFTKEHKVLPYATLHKRVHCSLR